MLSKKAYIKKLHQIWKNEKADKIKIKIIQLFFIGNKIIISIFSNNYFKKTRCY